MVSNYNRKPVLRDDIARQGTKKRHRGSIKRLESLLFTTMPDRISNM
jgi:hypothetical protein